MKKTAGLFLLCSFALLAADFWQKPYTNWSEKDAAKLLTDSPWAKSASVSMELSNDDVGASSTHSAVVPGAL